MTHSIAAICCTPSSPPFHLDIFALLPKLLLFIGTTLAVGPIHLVQSNPHNNSPFLDVFLRVEPVDDFCGALQCNITYAISVLTNTQNQFDLQSVMLQDGHMTRRADINAAGRYFFEENTVVRLSEQLRRAQEKIYLGVMFFDVPDDFQDYLVVEVSDVIQQGRRAKTEFSSDAVKIGIQVYRRNEAISSHVESAGNNNNLPSAEHHHHHHISSRHHHLHSRGERRLPERACTCAERNCGCCEHVTVRKIHLDDEVCVNVTYVSEDIGVRLALSVDNHIYYSKELSLRNPPPACFEVPHLRQYASICVRLYNMELRDERLTGCSEIEAILLHVRVARQKIGCFSIPI